ncbi:MAG TPA: sulfite exporter TauE/SafE family protein [Verrucomicrobiae bacterium]|nr:sulfite exporter TauE/SafE family protein [Verrucomicrobiae bacterium]
MMLAFALALALLIGLSLGLLGSGGSIITLPALVYVAGIPAHEAVGMSLVVVGGTSIVGSLLNARRGSLDWKAGAFFAMSGMAGAFVGAKFTHWVSALVLLFLFGALMLVVGARMLLKNETDTQPQQCRLWRCLGAGVAVGILTGFLGVGGGFLILPALVLFAGLEMKRAIGTSLAIIAVNCLGGLIGQLRYVNLDWHLTLAFLAAAVAGMFAGTALTSRLSAATLRRGFAWCVLLLGAILVGWNGMGLIGMR